jgi:1-acyl-sn-glycerol-3-phosphate acyltransferase
MRKLLRRLLYTFFRVFTRLKVTGVENIPLKGSCLLTGNHLGLIDGPLIYCLIPRDDAVGLAARKYRRNPFSRILVEATGGIWIDRTRTDFQALKEAYAHLENKGLLGVAPEGTRSDNNTMMQAKKGVAYLAYKSDPIILPTAVTGSENALRKMLTLKRPEVHVHFGEPFKLPPLDRKNRDTSLQHNTDEIMCRIAALLPKAYHGVYADHPRLIELLEKGVYNNTPNSFSS